MRRTICLFILCLLVCYVDKSTANRSQQVVNQDQCMNALKASDENNDGKVTDDEYVTMVQMMGPTPDFLVDAQSFYDLPLGLRSNFYTLACLCSRKEGNTSECCLGENAHISLAGIDNPVGEDPLYFFTVCLATEKNIQQVIGTQSPTSSLFPSVSPTIVSSVFPSEFPSMAPVSPAPITPSPVTPSPVTPSPITPSPVTPAPVTPSPVTPAPITPAPITPSPVTPAPVTPSPVTPAPITPSPVTPAPVTPSPVTLSPVTPAPVTPSPVTPAPITPSPVTPAPITPSPVTPAPITPSPITPAPITPSPITPAPVTPPPSSAPVTPAPTTPAPITPSPVTAAPVTPPPSSAPITPAPVTPAPITPAPVTAAPSIIGELFIPINYEVGFIDNDSLSYERYLQDAMDALATEIAEGYDSYIIDVTGTQVTGMLQTPSKSACPPLVIDTLPSATCTEIGHVIVMTVSKFTRDFSEIETLFETAIMEAINNGELQNKIYEQAPSSNSYVPVFIVNGYDALLVKTEAPTEYNSANSAGSLSAGAAAGIAIGAVVAIAAVGALLYFRRRGSRKEEDAFFPGGPTSTREIFREETEGDIMPHGADSSNLGANPPDYRKSRKTSQTASKTLAEGESKSVEGGVDSSSNAGSSGWSSSAGVSSLNTGSSDSVDILDKEGMHAASLAGIGRTSAIAGVDAIGNKDGSGDVPDVPNVTREDLDSAIESGDWAAVGATAALLAAASDSQSYSSRSRKTDTSMSRGGSSVSSLDAARAAELDHLVDAGDWEGVVVAAAKFEASEDTSTGGSRETNTAGGSSGYGSQSGSISESPSKAAKRDEIRSEVESLVRRVVPEEIDNVDEMMLQFKGREEELVETLRTMQERQVAQKARVQGQKQAKRDARQTAREGGIALPGPPASAVDQGGSDAAVDIATAAVTTTTETAAATITTTTTAPIESNGKEGISAAAAAGIGLGVAAAAGIAAAVGDNTSDEMSDSSSSRSETSGSSESGSESRFAQGAIVIPSMLGDDDSGTEGSTAESSLSSKKRRTALELAIEAGDWEAVGEAAAMMSDASVTTTDTSEINAIAEQGETNSLSGDATGDGYRVNADRASELDEMIDAGDWTGVVAAANRYNTADSRASSAALDVGASMDESAVVSLDSSDVPMETTSIEEEQEKEKRIKEEQEALAQAEIWMAIAEQSKSEGSPDAGASDAADWAIARSLSALKKAEQKGELEGNEASEDSQDRSV